MSSINKAEFVDALATKLDSTKVDAEKYLSAVQEVIVDNVKAGNEVKLSGFASFRPDTQAARTVRNPATGDPINVPEKRVVKIRPLGKFKDSVANG